MCARHHNLQIGANTAEEIKISIGCVYERPEERMMPVKGRDLKSGLPREVTVSSMEVFEALRRQARQISDEVLTVLEQTQPELVADISHNGIVLTGGGSLLWGFDRLIGERNRNQLQRSRRRRILCGLWLRQEPQVARTDAGRHHQSCQKKTPCRVKKDAETLKCLRVLFVLFDFLKATAYTENDVKRL